MRARISAKILEVALLISMFMTEHITYMWNLKYNTNEHIYKTETDLQIQRTDLWLPRGKKGGGGKDWD